MLSIMYLQYASPDLNNCKTMLIISAIIPQICVGMLSFKSSMSTCWYLYILGLSLKENMIDSDSKKYFQLE